MALWCHRPPDPRVSRDVGASILAWLQPLWCSSSAPALRVVPVIEELVQTAPFSQSHISATARSSRLAWPRGRRCSRCFSCLMLFLGRFCIPDFLLLFPFFSTVSALFRCVQTAPFLPFSFSDCMSPLLRYLLFLCSWTVLSACLMILLSALRLVSCRPLPFLAASSLPAVFLYDLFRPLLFTHLISQRLLVFGFLLSAFVSFLGRGLCSPTWLPSRLSFLSVRPRSNRRVSC